MKEGLRQHLGTLIPRILRAKHDPNPQTREQMSALWTRLIGRGSESRLVLSRHLLTTLDVLIDETSSKLWRARVGSCSALAEIIVGRDWIELGGGGAILDDDDIYSGKGALSTAGVRLLKLWRVTIRALDDVRIPVRDSGASLARSLKGLTVRLCDPATPESAREAKRGKTNGTSPPYVSSTAAAATSLRWLVRHGLTQHAEGAGICISTMVDIIGLVTPRILEPVLPELLKSLLLAVSGLEPAALNYLQLRTNDQEGLERVRLQLTQSGPLAAAIEKCLELTPGSSSETQQDVVIQLDAALRQASGFATRSATADAVNSLCITCPGAFRFRSTGTANPSVRLLRALYEASERERSSASRDHLIHAVGSLAALCPGPSVRSLAVKLCRKYTRSMGNNDDPMARRAAAAALRSIAVRSSSQLSDGGQADIWNRLVLPVAFVGRKDTDTKVSSLWQEVWEEASTASLSSFSQEGSGTTVEEAILNSLTKECVGALDDLSWSRRVTGCKALIELCDQNILSPLLRKGSEGFEARSKRRTEAARLALEKAVVLMRKPRLWKGKSDVLLVVTKITSSWLPCVSQDEPSLDLAVAANSDFSLDDLFVNDHWFATGRMNDEDTAAGNNQMRCPTVETEDENKVDMDVEGLEPSATTDFFEGRQGKCSEKQLTLTGLCRLFLEGALASEISILSDQDDVLPYQQACLAGLNELLRAVPSMESGTALLRDVFYPAFSVRLLPIIESKEKPPVLIAGALACLAAMFWEGFGSGPEDVALLVKQVHSTGFSMQAAWTVREACGNLLAELEAVCDLADFRRPVFLSHIIESATHCMADRKFVRVR